MKKNNILKKINNKGLSLIELMVVLTIFSIIILGLVTFFTGGARSWILGQSQLSAQRNARQAIDQMVREIRHGELISAGSDTSITVVIPAFEGAAGYSVTYSWSGDPWDPINRIVSSVPNTLINNVLSLAFTYFDNSGNSVAPGNASKVLIVLKVDVDKDSNPDITLNSDVNLRNYAL